MLAAVVRLGPPQRIQVDDHIWAQTIPPGGIAAAPEPEPASEVPALHARGPGELDLVGPPGADERTAANADRDVGQLLSKA
jgi:hypothetical protein